MGHCGVRVVSLSLSIVVQYSSGCDDGAESIVAEYFTAETVIAF